MIGLGGREWPPLVTPRRGRSIARSVGQRPLWPFDLAGRCRAGSDSDPAAEVSVGAGLLLCIPVASCRSRDAPASAAAWTCLSLGWIQERCTGPVTATNRAEHCGYRAPRTTAGAGGET